MFAATNLLLTRKQAAAGGGPPTFQAASNGVNSVNVGGSPATFTEAFTAAAGADVFLAVVLGGTATAPTPVTYNGNTLSLVSSKGLNNNTANGCGYLYRGAGMGTGSSANFSYVVPAVTWAWALWASYTGVSSVGTPVTNYGSGTSLSTGSVAVTSPQLGLGFTFFYGTAAHWTGTSGGTSRGSGDNNYAGLALRDATTTATFTGTTSNPAGWSTIGVVLQ